MQLKEANRVGLIMTRAAKFMRMVATGGLLLGFLQACGVPGTTLLSKGDLAFDTAKIFTKKRIAIETGGMPDFRAKEPTSGIMAGGMAGQIAAATAGNQIVSENGVPNPAEQVGANIRAALANRNNASAAASRLAADLVIEVDAYDWTVATYSQDPSKYYIVFSAIARMKDAQSEEVLGQTTCKNVITETQAPTAPTYEEMMANGAARLKSEMAEITRKCADQIIAKSLA